MNLKHGVGLRFMVYYYYFVECVYSGWLGGPFNGLKVAFVCFIALLLHLFSCFFVMCHCICLGLRLSFVSIFYCMRAQDLRRKSQAAQ